MRTQLLLHNYMLLTYVQPSYCYVCTRQQKVHTHIQETKLHVITQSVLLAAEINARAAAIQER